MTRKLVNDHQYWTGFAFWRTARVFARRLVWRSGQSRANQEVAQISQRRKAISSECSDTLRNRFEAWRIGRWRLVVKWKDSRIGWARITRQACWDFISILKLYHRSCVYHLRLQATNLEASIETRFGGADIRALRSKEEKIYAKWSQQLQERRNKKYKKLHSPVSITDKIKFCRLKQGCRRFKRRTPYQLEWAAGRSHQRWLTSPLSP